MPYELVDFVQNDSTYNSLYRYGGNMNLLKSLIASGFPVLVEKQVYEKSITDGPGQVSWLGHYAFVTGYGRISQGVFFYQDTYPPAELVGKTGRSVILISRLRGGHSITFLYWYIRLIVNRRSLTFLDLGRIPNGGNQHALDIAESGNQDAKWARLVLAWFNKGTSDVQLLQYNDAATAYDQAFTLYPSLPIAPGLRHIE